MLAPIIMNDKRIASIIGRSGITSYACPKRVSERLNAIYAEHVSDGKPFEGFYFAVKNKRLK